MMVRRNALVEVGNFDEGYFMHCEDLDWCMRFHKCGWKILFVPEARVIHHKGVSTRSRPISTEWHKHKGMVRLHHKFMADRYSGFVLNAVAIAAYIRFAVIALRLLLARTSTGVPHFGRFGSVFSFGGKENEKAPSDPHCCGP